MIKAQHLVFGQRYNVEGLQFAYSTHKIVPSATNCIICKNSAGSFQNIGFSSGVVDGVGITSFSAGAQSYAWEVFDQTGRLPNVVAAKTIDNTYAPMSSNSSGVGVPYLGDTTSIRGLNNKSYSNLDINMANDLIIQYVLRNELVASSGRASFSIRTNLSGKAGVFTVSIYTVSTVYRISIKHDYATANNSTAQIHYEVPKSLFDTNFALLTFTKIGGVVKLYINGTEYTSTSLAVDMPYNLQGIWIGVGYGSGFDSSGVINNFKTLSLYSGLNLSSFDLTAYINQYKSIHGIS